MVSLSFKETANSSVTVSSSSSEGPDRSAKDDFTPPLALACDGTYTISLIVTLIRLRSYLIVLVKILKAHSQKVVYGFVLTPELENVV